MESLHLERQEIYPMYEHIVFLLEIFSFNYLVSISYVFDVFKYLKYMRVRPENNIQHNKHELWVHHHLLLLEKVNYLSFTCRSSKFETCTPTSLFTYHLKTKE